MEKVEHEKVQEQIEGVKERLSALKPVDTVYSIDDLATPGLITEVIWCYCFDQGPSRIQRTIDWIFEIREEWDRYDPTVRKHLMDQWEQRRQNCDTCKISSLYFDILK